MAETHPKFDVALVTPEGETFRGEAEMLVVPERPARSACSHGTRRSSRR